MDKVDRLIRELQDVRQIGIVNAKHAMEICGEAAVVLGAQQRRIEDLEERVAIMMESSDREKAVAEALGEIRI